MRTQNRIIKESRDRNAAALAAIREEGIRLVDTSEARAIPSIGGLISTGSEFEDERQFGNAVLPVSQRLLSQHTDAPSRSWVVVMHEGRACAVTIAEAEAFGYEESEWPNA